MARVDFSFDTAHKIEDICRNGNVGVGKPELLTGNLAGFWSRRINDKDRLVYKIIKEQTYTGNEYDEYIRELEEKHITTKENKDTGVKI